MRALLKNEWTIIFFALVASILTAILTFTHANAVLTFSLGAISLATLAIVVGGATEQLGNFLGPGATGVVEADDCRADQECPAQRLGNGHACQDRGECDPEAGGSSRR